MAAGAAAAPETALVAEREGEAALEVSVILPARNEEANLAACLKSLLGQTELGFALGREWELILVNDASADRTRVMFDEAAAGHPAVDGSAAVTVMDAPELDTSPRGGFTGKNNACWAAAQVARGARLLFTDADTVHEPGSISRSLREADKHGAALLSYSPRQITTGMAQRLVMPLIFSELASVYPPAQVSDPSRKVAAANGQFLLIEAETYFSVGGHRAVGPDVLEDVAIARNVKRGQRNLRFRYAPDALSTRMYPDTVSMIEGWTKNLARLMPRPIYLALWRVLDLLLLVCLPTIALGFPTLVPWQRAVIGVLWLRTAFRFYSRVSRAHFPVVDTAISPLGIPLFVFLLLRSTFARRVTWKGRSYGVSR